MVSSRLWLLTLLPFSAALELPGCFVDCHNPRIPTEKRQLELSVCNAVGPCAYLSREWCGHYCADKGFALAGVEAGHGCFCGNVLSNASATAPSAACNYPCTGIKTETCGGNCAIWVFNSSSVGPIPPSPPLPPTPPPTPPPPPPGPWPKPDAAIRPIFHMPGNNPSGYVGDANGMMFRRVPWNSSSDEGGMFHLFWQCFIQSAEDYPNPPSTCPPSGCTHALWWCHAASSDYVLWKHLPPAIGPGAESGGVAQLDNGDIVAVFNELGKGRHLQARPKNHSDPFLTEWEFTDPDGSPCVLSSARNSGGGGGEERAAGNGENIAESTSVADESTSSLPVCTATNLPGGGTDLNGGMCLSPCACGIARLLRIDRGMRIKSIRPPIR
jgi:hypothetical protein